VWIDKQTPVFQRKVLFPSSTPKMEAEDSSEALTSAAAIIYRNEALISCYYLIAFVFYE
jgi:hypothetical protein